MATVWFTSDLHISHEKVAAIRGFRFPSEHDETIRKNWLNQVEKDDQVWVLGDLAVHGYHAALEFLTDLPGRKHLILGNHDAAHPMHRNAHRFQSRYFSVFDSVQTFARRRINGGEVLLSHFPYDTDHTEVVRYTQYRLRDEGKWLLHGHTHGKERRHGHQIHVGLDAWDMHLVEINCIADLIRGAPDE